MTVPCRFARTPASPWLMNFFLCRSLTGATLAATNPLFAGIHTELLIVPYAGYATFQLLTQFPHLVPQK